MVEAEAVLSDDKIDYQMLYFTCSSLSMDDKVLYGITDYDGMPNIFSYNLENGGFKILSDNTDGVLKSYVYFDGNENAGLGKASVTFDPAGRNIYFIQGDEIRKISGGRITVLNRISKNRVTAFTHVSFDGRVLAVPTTDGRALDYDLEREGCGLDSRPVFSVDQRCIEEDLNSYISFFDTASGELLKEITVPRCWITHVVFSPVNPKHLLFNNEWTCRDTGVRRMWLYDGLDFRPVRSIAEDRSADDWVCHEMWMPDGGSVIYHGEKHGRAFVGRIDISSGLCREILLDPSYTSYGHFTVDGRGDLICDGYFRFPGEKLADRYNSTDNGPDPHKKNGRYISIVYPDWEGGKLCWKPLTAHDSDWLGQDSHPHPVASHDMKHVYFSSRRKDTIGIYRIRY